MNPVSSTPAAAGRPVVITGAAGFVGSHLVRALAHAGRRVIGTDVRLALPDRLLAGIADARVSYVAGDLRRDETIDRLIAAADGPVDVIHTAAMIRFGQLSRSLGEAEATIPAALDVLDVNAMGSWRLYARFAGEDVLGRFIHVSTRSVFGGRPQLPDRIDEDSPCQPAGMYGSSKAAAEAGLLAMRDQFGTDLVVARITGVFGPWQGPVSWIGQAIDAVVAGRPYRADAGSDDAYELTYVKDTVRGLMLLLQAGTLRHAIYHVASGQRLVTLAEVAAAIRAAEPAADVDFGPGRHPGASGRAPLNIERATADVGFAARWNLSAAMKDYLRIERGGRYQPEVMEMPPVAEQGAGQVVGTAAVQCRGTSRQ
jgi:nucleoside-diphosphate-sugar epimerase